MAADWDWCSAPPVMSEESDEEEFERWRTWFVMRVMDKLKNPLTVMGLALDDLEDAGFTGKHREAVEMALRGHEELKLAVTKLQEAAYTNRQEDLE